MVEVICPNDGWIYKFRDYEGNEDYIEQINPEPEETEDTTEEPQDSAEQGTILASIDDSTGDVIFYSERMDDDFE